MAHDINNDDETGDPSKKKETIIENGRARREPFEDEDDETVHVPAGVIDGVEDLEEGRTMSDEDVKDALEEEDGE